MAVAINTVGVNTADVGTWNGEDVINLLEQQLTWLEWHGDTDYGLVSGISSVNVGNNVLTGSDNEYFEAYVTETTGIGTGAELYGHRITNNIDGFYDHNGELTFFQVNRCGKNYVGGEVIKIPSSYFGGTYDQDHVTAQVIVDSTISGGVSYAVTFTTNVDYWYATGEDRNGSVLGPGTTITIKEGDTLTLVGNMGSSSARYYMGIVDSGTFGGSLAGCYQTSVVDNVDHAVDVHYSNGYSNDANATVIWTPEWGQRGTYYVKPLRDSTTIATDEALHPTIIVEPADAGNISTTGYGSTTTFYDAYRNGSTSSAVWKQVIDENKRYGTTWRGFVFNNSNSTLYLLAGSGYNPTPTQANNSTTSKTATGGHGYGRRFSGTPYLDWSNLDVIHGSESKLLQTGNLYQQGQTSLSTGGSTTYELNLIVYRSGIDPNFAVFSFFKPTASSTVFDTTTKSTFFFSNYTTNVWDLDYLYLSGVTVIDGEGGNTTDPKIKFKTYLEGIHEGTNYPSKRSAEFGYDQYYGDTSDTFFEDTYEAKTYEQTLSTNTVSIYYRPGGTDKRTTGGISQAGPDKLDPSTDFNAVIKGIPLSTKMIPCPYYLPDDFVLIQFDYNQTGANIQQGDTITISGSEIYKVIEASYNQTTRTRGILFCARIV